MPWLQKGTARQVGGREQDDGGWGKGWAGVGQHWKGPASRRVSFSVVGAGITGL